MEICLASAQCLCLVNICPQNELIGLSERLNGVTERWGVQVTNFQRYDSPGGGVPYGSKGGQRLSFSTSCCSVLSLALHLHFPERVQTGHHLSYLWYSGKGGGWQPGMISTLDDRWFFCHNNRAISEPKARRKRGWFAPGWHQQAARVKKKD